jgi:proline racemase
MQRFVKVPGLGAIAVDVAYGDMMYVIVSAIELGFTLERSEARSLVEVGEHINFRQPNNSLPCIPVIPVFIRSIRPSLQAP